MIMRYAGNDSTRYLYVNLYGKSMRVELTRSASWALESLTAPLYAEIHLILGCLVVKRVWFKPETEAEAVPVSGNLYTSFRTVRYSKQCRLSHIDREIEEPVEYPLVREKRVFVPHWLKIDYRKGKWTGMHGYD